MGTLSIPWSLMNRLRSATFARRVVDHRRRRTSAASSHIHTPGSSSIGTGPSILLQGRNPPWAECMSESSANGIAPATSQPLIAPGARIGKYEVVHRIACGGMAEIYLARASGIHGFEKYVVLKRILPQYADNEDFVRMFLKEARV